MSTVTNGRLFYAAHPTGFQQPGVHTKYVEEQIDLEKVALDGGVLIKTLALSSDPYIRVRMRDSTTKHVFPHLHLGRAVDNFGVGIVIRSDDPKYHPGEYVYGYLGFENYTVYPGPPEFQHALQFLKKLDKNPNLPASIYVGTLGMPGETAYQGWHAYVGEKAKTSKTLFVSGAAGPVGTFLIEYARLKAPHLKIIASAGSQEKLDILKEAGADVVINYKTTDLDKALAEHGPIDIYWDHVSGRTLDTTLVHMSDFGIVLRVGNGSEYNNDSEAIKHMAAVNLRSLIMYGFVVNVGPVVQKAGKHFFEDATKLVLNGTIKNREHKYNGLKEAGQALADVHLGNNVGKAVIIVAEE